MLEPVAAELGAQLVWVIGNHDRRGAVRTALLGSDPADTELDAVHDLAGLRLVVLDTSVPGHEYGELTDAQLDWLAGVAHRPQPRGRRSLRPGNRTVHRLRSVLHPVHSGDRCRRRGGRGAVHPGPCREPARLQVHPLFLSRG